MDTLFNDFRSANLGHGLDYDGVYGDQCVDLINFWARTLGTGPFSGPTALNLSAPSGWRWVANTPSGVPPEGAVVKANYAPNGSTIPCIEQNWNGHMYVTDGSHSYNGVLGWWICTNVPSTPTPIVNPSGNKTVPINVSIVNVRTAPNTAAPIAGSLHKGYCVVTGEVQGSNGTVGTHTSNMWYITLNGHFFNAAATE
jgi:hypothetical protein